jgi:hypothetical protein
MVLGRMPHVRHSVHPDFLSSSLALTNFMRLSLMKAAHASVGGAPRRKSGTMGRERILRMLSLHGQGLLLLAAVASPHSKSVWRGCARLFLPMYAGANMGHPSRGEGFVLCSHRGDADVLHKGSYPNLISDLQAAGSVLVINRYESVSRTR